MSNVGTDSYTLAMLDKINGPLDKVMASVGKLDGMLDKLQDQAGKTSSILAGMAGGAVVGAIGLLGSALSGVIGILEKGVGLMKDFIGTVLDASRFRSQNILSLDLFAGKGKGEGMFNNLLKFGGVLPMDERDLVRQGTSLVSAGYKGNQLDAVNAALADVSATRGEQYRANLELHFLRLKNEASPDARDVKMAAIDTGIGQQGVFKQLFAAKGIQAPAELFQQEKLYESLKKQGKITGNDVANAIVAGIQEKYDQGGALGSAGKRLGMGTLSGLITNLQAAPERFLAQMKLEDLPGIKSLMNFIKRVLVFFDHATPQGQKLTAVIEKMVNALLGGLDRFDEGSLGRMFKRAVGFADTLAKTIEHVWGFVENLLDSDFDSLLTSGAQILVDVGRLIGQGIWEAFFGGGAKKPASQLAADKASIHTEGVYNALGVSDELRTRGTNTALAHHLYQMPQGEALTLATPAYIKAAAEKKQGGAGATGSTGKGDVHFHPGAINLTVHGDPTEQQKQDLHNQVTEIFRQAATRVGAEASP